MATEIALQYVSYNTDYSVVICIQNKNAITPNEGIWRHFQQLHKGIPSEAREAIKAFGKSVVVKGPKDVLMPSTEISPLNDLEVLKDGFRCIHSNCKGYLCGTLKVMQQHCQKTHGWVKKDGTMWRPQALQTFFKGNK